MDETVLLKHILDLKEVRSQILDAVNQLQQQIAELEKEWHIKYGK